MGIADDMKKLDEDIAASYDMRVKAIEELVKDTHKMLKGFQKEHKEMAANLRKNLEQGESDRLNAFQSMMAEIQEGVKEIEIYVKNKLKEFDDAHAKMSEELKKELAKYVDDMVNATRKLMNDIQTRKKERKAEVADLLAEVPRLLETFKTEREKMSAHWQSMAATMAEKRGIKSISVG